jgi:hypothetical protein
MIAFTQRLAQRGDTGTQFLARRAAQQIVLVTQILSGVPHEQPAMFNEP